MYPLSHTETKGSAHRPSYSTVAVLRSLANARPLQCDRQYPCNRCSRRRRPELCAYYSFQPQAPGLPPHGLVTPPEKNRDEDLIHVAADGWEQDNIHEDELEEESSATPGTPRQRNGSTSLAEAFGYDGRSECNTMALVRKVW